MKPLMKSVKTLKGVKTDVEEFLFLVQMWDACLTIDTGEEWYLTSNDAFKLKYKGKEINAKEIELIFEEK